jgi:hypothetical protein
MFPFIAALLWKCNTGIVARVVETFVSIVATITVTLLWKRPKLTVMQQALSRYYGYTATHCYTTGTATLLWKCNMVHRSCYQGKPNMSILLLVRSAWRRDVGAVTEQCRLHHCCVCDIGRFATIKMDCGHCWRVTL